MMANRKRLGFSTMSPRQPKNKRPNTDIVDNSVSRFESLTPSELVMKALLSACRSTLKPHHEEGDLILNKVEKLYYQANKDFVDSDGFIRRVQELEMKVRTTPDLMFAIVKDLFNEIKAYKVTEPKEKSGKVKPSMSDNAESNGTDVKEGNEVADSESKPSTSSKGKPSTSAKGKASSGQIARLEKILEAHHKEIRACEEKELSLDDLENDDNDYIISERLKKRAAKIYLRLCDLKGRSHDMGGTREKRFKYSGSRYSELNIHIQNFVNRHSLEERMPDYSDVRKVVKKCNEKYKYHLNKRRIDDLSKEVFTDVGGALSDLRKKDFSADFGPLEANKMLQRQTDDPAFFDRKLQDTLKRNKSIAELNLKKEFQKWADLDEESQNQTPAAVSGTEGNNSGGEKKDKELAKPDEAGDGEKEAGDGKKEAGDCEKEAGDGEKEAGDGEEAGDVEEEAGDGEVEAGDGEAEAGDGEEEAGDGEVEAGDVEEEAGDGEEDGESESSSSSDEDDELTAATSLEAEDQPEDTTAENEAAGESAPAGSGDAASRSSSSCSSSTEEGEKDIGELSLSSNSDSDSDEEPQITEEDVIPSAAEEPEVIELSD